jgi:mannose-6-phosphate isomerase-like protein (cupin superfamily)
MERININEKFELFQDHWNPKIIADLNGQQVKLAKLKGEFVWHQHEHEDELFFVVKGNLKMQFRDRTVEIGENEMVVVPRGIEHRPVADEEVWIMLFEPASTLNTGNVTSNITKPNLERI